MGRLIMVVGNSGAGKTSIMRSLMDNEIISITTRDKRKGEKEGIDYDYISHKKFDKLLNEGKLAEHSSYSGNSYGITHDEITSKLAAGDCFAIVEHYGMLMLTAYCMHNHIPYTTIFIYNTLGEAIKCMLDRGDSLDQAVKRTARYDEETALGRTHCQYIVYNPYGRMRGTRYIISGIVNAYKSFSLDDNYREKMSVVAHIKKDPI